MDPRISTLESDVAAMRANVETMHSNYATNLAVHEAETRLRLEIISAKADLEGKIERVKNDLKFEFQNVAGEMRNWLMGTVIGLFIGFGGLVLGIATIMRP